MKVIASEVASYVYIVKNYKLTSIKFKCHAVFHAVLRLHVCKHMGTSENHTIIGTESF